MSSEPNLGEVEYRQEGLANVVASSVRSYRPDVVHKRAVQRVHVTVYDRDMHIAAQVSSLLPC